MLAVTTHFGYHELYEQARICCLVRGGKGRRGGEEDGGEFEGESSNGIIPDYFCFCSFGEEVRNISQEEEEDHDLRKRL